MSFSYSQSTALVTGASRGIGAEIARVLASRGIARLILTARTEADLEMLAGEISVKHDVPVTIITADLTQSDAPQRIYDTIQARGLQVDLLVNNAGFGFYGPFESAEANRDHRMISVNVDSLVALTRLFLPGMKSRRAGGILNVASTAAFQPVPYMATYAATKAFVLSFSEAVWAECQEYGVAVTCLCPGGTETAFDFGTGKRGKFEETPRDSPRMVAEVGIDALERDTPHVVVGFGNTLIAHSNRFLPRWVMARAVETAFRPKPEAGVGRAEGPARLRNPALLGALAVGAVGLTAALVLRKRVPAKG